MSLPPAPPPAAFIERPVGNDAYIALCDHVFWSNDAPRENPSFRHGDAVFCKIDEVWRLFRALRRTRKRIVLVTGEGDKPVTSALYWQKPPHVAHWFGTNMFADEADTTPLPLGLGREGSPATLDWKDIKAAADSAPPRDKLLYANFGTASNPAVREPLRAWLDQPAQSWITREPHAASGKQAYLRSLFSHRFVLCPPGNGEDTHRMWEALYCGAIPVVRESSALRGFRQLPCVFLSDLRECTEQVLLPVSRAPAASRGTAPSLLQTAHWARQFARAAEPLRQGRPVGWRLWFTAWWQEAKRAKTW